MIVDMNTVGFKFAIDVQRVRKVYIQARAADGDATAGVIQVKRAFDGQGNTPRLPFGSVLTVDMDGSTILEVDTDDEAYLHFEVTTAVAGTTIEIGTLKSGTMKGYASSIEIDTEHIGVRGKLEIGGSKKAFMLAEASVAQSSAVVQMKKSIADNFPLVSFSPTAVLTLDGSTIIEVDSMPAGTIYADCTTLQSLMSVRVWFYIRNALTNEL